MSERIQAVRGMNDVLPTDSFAWQHIEAVLREIATKFAYQEIRLPILEHTSLFKRSIGEITDIVEKEMYTFSDKNGDSLTLRPEGTAGCVRACIEHGLLYNTQQKLWYMGPMFRHERPQKGRYRQFVQFGIEAFGFAGFGIELELLAICQNLWQILGVSEHVSLEINTLGTSLERAVYRDKLIDYFKENLDGLDEDSLRRLERNPLRILDSKNPALNDLIAKAPSLIDSLGDESRAHFEKLCNGLNVLGISYHINPRLVRGLDYYSHTVFEWVTDSLGSQSTVCAGGRYDALVTQLGGQHTPSVGFAMGLERLLLLIQNVNPSLLKPICPDVYIITEGDTTLLHALQCADMIRAGSSLRVYVNTMGGSFKSQFKKADKSGARFAVIVGEQALTLATVDVKNLREQSAQQTVRQQSLLNYLLMPQE